MQGVIQKVHSLETSSFCSPYFSLVNSGSFYIYPPLPLQRAFVLVSYLPPLQESFATFMTLISNKNWGMKRKKRINFFVNSAYKVNVFLHSYIYNDNTNIYMFIKNVKQNKNVYPFLIKKTPLYVGLDSKQKTFSNCQATYQEEICLLFENQVIFFTLAKVQIGLTPPPSPPIILLVCFLRIPHSLHNKRTF